MAKYAAVSDVTTRQVTVSEENLLAADAEVEQVLFEKGIDPTDITLPQPTLTLLAVAIASGRAARDEAQTENSPMTVLAASFEREATRLAGRITRASLGLATASSGGLGSIPIGRR